MSRLLHICIEERDPNGANWILAWSLPPIIDYHSHEHLEKHARKAPKNVSKKTAALMWEAKLKRGTGFVLTTVSLNRANYTKELGMFNVIFLGLAAAMTTMSGWWRMRMIFWFEGEYGGRGCFRSQK